MKASDAMTLWFHKRTYLIYQKAKDKRTLTNAAATHKALALRVDRLWRTPDLQLAAKKALAAHDTEVSLAHERWCRYVGTPHFNRAERVLAA